MLTIVSWVVAKDLLDIAWPSCFTCSIVVSNISNSVYTTTVTRHLSHLHFGRANAPPPLSLTPSFDFVCGVDESACVFELLLVFVVQLRSSFCFVRFLVF